MQLHTSMLLVYGHAASLSLLTLVLAVVICVWCLYGVMNSAL
jgi:hypothetical protein